MGNCWFICGGVWEEIRIFKYEEEEMYRNFIELKLVNIYNEVIGYFELWLELF